MAGKLAVCGGVGKVDQIDTTEAVTLRRVVWLFLEQLRLASAPLVDGLRGCSEVLCKNCARVIAGLNYSPYLRCGRRLPVKMDQHGRTPFRMPLRTDLAMTHAYRRGCL